MSADSKPDSKNNTKWIVLATVMIGTFLGGLNMTIANLALPKIISDFGITVSMAGWISTAYIIANAVLVPVWGKLGDMIGRKKVYILGFSIFIVGSILTGLAWNFSSMVVFRVIQAIAVSADYPTAMAIIAVTFTEGRERAQALGIWSASFAISSVFGPLIGGPLIDAFGWRSVFFISIPTGLFGIFMALRYVKEFVNTKADANFDFKGAVTLGLTLTALVLVLEKGLDWGWFSIDSIITYAAVILFGTIFYFTERKNKEPIVDFKFFKNTVFVGTLANNFIVFMGMMGAMFLLPIFVQTYLGYGATQTGYLFMPMAFFMVLSAQIGGWMVGKVKANWVICISTLIAAFGIYLFSFYIDPKSTALDIIIPISVMAMGLGLGMSQRTVAITSSVPVHEVGMASSVLALARNIAGAFGIAIFSTILTNATKSSVLQIAQNTVIHTSNPMIIGEVTALIGFKAQITAFATVFTVSSILVLIGAIVSFFVKIPDFKNKKTEQVPVE